MKNFSETDMKTEIVKLSQIQVNGANPRQITDAKFQKLIDSILALPKMLELRPIVVDNMMTALGGNMRYRALTAIADMDGGELRKRLLSLRDVQKKTKAEQDVLADKWLAWLDSPTAHIIRASNLTSDEQREFIIKDNASFGDWDMDALANEWDAVDLDNWGCIKWDDLPPWEDVKAEDDNFDEAEGVIEVRCKVGDVWQLGKHRLMCGDSVKLEEVKKLMGGGVS